MVYPSWITQPYLGSYPQEQSFDLDPLVIQFQANPGSSISILNGELPQGLSWSVVNSTILITGLSVQIEQTVSVRFTFRIRQTDGLVSDRTFSIEIVPSSRLPSWQSQPGFLGYQTNLETSTYQLTAIPPPGDFVIYEILTPTTGAYIDAYSGLLTYDSSSLTINTTVLIGIRATSVTGFSDIDVSIDVIAMPSAPSWITAAGSIGTFSGDDFLEIQLIADDPFGSVSYLLSSFSPADFPFLLTSTGLLYGQSINPLSETRYDFTVIATSVNGSSSRSFYVTILPSETSNLLRWETPENLGTFDEGQYLQIPIRASTSRLSQITYHVVGGILPPHLMMNFTTGDLVGFCEYHAIDKIYRFDASVTDGYQTIYRQFTININKIYNDQFFQAYIPMISPLKENTLSDVSNLRVRSPGTVVFNRISDVPDTPYLNIINGVVTGFSTPDEIVSNASPYLSQLNIQLGSVSNSSISNNDLSYLYRHMVDGQVGTNLSVYSSGVYNTNVQTNGIVTPISIENIRRSISYNRSFVSGGSGQGTVLFPVVDFSNGSLASVIAVNPGYGYRSRPELFVTGSGTGAEAQAIIGISGIAILDPGQGWNVGDTVVIPGNHERGPAMIEVTEIGTLGSVSSLRIVDRGDYLQVSAADFIDISLGTATMSISPTWGMVSVNVISNGQGYECGISITIGGGEILPQWQDSYFPAVELGKIEAGVASDAAGILNDEPTTMWGIPWNPNYIVFHWQGIKWFGSATFDSETTTFDGDSTRFQETEDVRITVFDGDQTVFNDRQVTFDYNDPLAYDLFQVWGGTLIDQGTTVFDLYQTIFDALSPRKDSKTSLKKWISMPHRIYSGNNAVW